MPVNTTQNAPPFCNQSAYSVQPSNFFHHFAFASSVVLGDQLWIHGGEIGLWNCTGDGSTQQGPQGNLVSLPNNSTFSKDLSSSWNNASFSLNITEHAKAPALNAQALWADPTEPSFYAYGGGTAFWQYPVPPNQLWQFNPNPSGSQGDWSLGAPPASSNYSSLVRSYYSTNTYGGGWGFALGGFIEDETATVNPGLVMCNLTTQNWYNISASGYSQDGVSSSGAAHFVPSFGPAGLLFVLGGSVGEGILPGMDEIYMFDPTSQKWSSQKTSGTNPSSATLPCVVGSQGDNDTYEIFFYGGIGSSNENTVANGAVHVLSLPAFNWQVQDATPQYGRWGHTCNVIGNRQMVSIGGLVTNLNLPNTTLLPPSYVSFNTIADPWQQGIGVFDMSTMQWKDAYDHTAAPYTTPNIVKTYYQQNGREPASWSNDLVKGWFTGTGSNITAPSPSNSGSVSQTGLPSQTRLPKPSASKTGAIVGGTVGGVAAAAFIALLAFFLLRRRGRISSDSMYHKPELSSHYKNSRKAKTAQPVTEMDGNTRLYELPRKDQVSEMNGHQNLYEAP